MILRREGLRAFQAPVAIMLAVMAFTSFGAGMVSAATAKSSGIERSAKSIAFRNTMRKLWEDHVFYTRMVIISIDGDRKDLNPTVDRLLQNQVDIGNAIKPFYGDATGLKFTSILQNHINTAGDMLLAAKAGDTAKANDAKSRWYANGDAIADFLTGINPVYWPSNTMRPLIKKHLDTTVDEATARFNGDWKADIAAFDKANEHILVIADTLSLGIIRQFPDKFK